MTDQDILHSKFDINIHKSFFYDYLEVVIRPDGVIEYAVPSHQEKMKSICIEIHGLDNFLIELNSEAAYGDYLQWLCDYSGCVSVWNEFCVKPKSCTKEQERSLKLLSETYYTKGYGCKLYRGEIK